MFVQGEEPSLYACSGLCTVLDIQTKKKEGNSVYYFFKCASDYSRVF